MSRGVKEKPGNKDEEEGEMGRTHQHRCQEQARFPGGWQCQEGSRATGGQREL